MCVCIYVHSLLYNNFVLTYKFKIIVTFKYLLTYTRKSTTVITNIVHSYS